VLKEIEHGQVKLAVLGANSGELLGINPGRSVRERNDVVAFRHWWWFLWEGQ
jgi:hypothetical protein